MAGSSGLQPQLLNLPRDRVATDAQTLSRLDPAAAQPATRKKLLEQVVDAQLVMDAEYDLARQYLATP